MRTRENADTLARVMQGAALDPAGWEPCLNAVNAFVNGDGAVLLTVQARQRIAPSSTDMSEMMEDYFGRGWHANDRREACVPLLKSRGFVFDHEFQSEKDIVNCDYYSDFLARHRRKWFAGLGAAIDGDDWCLALQRAPDNEPFGRDDLARLQLVRGLLSNAAHLSTNLGQSWIAGLNQALHLMGEGALLFDSQARVMDANDAALPILAKYIDADRRLRFRDGTATFAFNTMLTPALHILESGTSEAVCEIRLGAGRYACRAMSLLRHENLIATKAAALVVIKPVRASPEDTMKRRFGLTDAEIKVAIGISNGRSVKEIAGGHKVRAETVRAQLKSIYNKTEVYTPAQLVVFVRDLSDAPDMPDGT